MNSSPSGRAGTQEVWSSGAKLGIEAGPDAAPVMASEVAIRPAIVQTLRKRNMRFLPRCGLSREEVGGCKFQLGRQHVRATQGCASMLDRLTRSGVLLFLA